MLSPMSRREPPGERVCILLCPGSNGIRFCRPGVRHQRRIDLGQHDTGYCICEAAAAKRTMTTYNPHPTVLDSMHPHHALLVWTLLADAA
jgi:hypothetical protein